MRYDLCASLQGGEEILLLQVMGEEGKVIVRLIEEKVEEYLAIQDEYVEGEHVSDRHGRHVTATAETIADGGPGPVAVDGLWCSRLRLARSRGGSLGLCTPPEVR